MLFLCCLSLSVCATYNYVLKLCYFNCWWSTMPQCMCENSVPSLFFSYLLQIIKKSCIEILAAEPSSVCAGGEEPHTCTHNTHTGILKSFISMRHPIIPSTDSVFIPECLSSFEFTNGIPRLKNDHPWTSMSLSTRKRKKISIAEFSQTSKWVGTEQSSRISTNTN